MLLSLCIPTYNRAKFLLKNLEQIAMSIRELHLESQIEINVSNNGSKDNTKDLIKKFMAKNEDIVFAYRENDENLGPDINFIQAMKMAQGKYSILLGDDDFFTNGGLSDVISLISNNQDIDIFLSNRIDYTEEGKYIANHYFIRNDINDRCFDFSNDSDAGYYFYLCKDVGGCLTFISSIIYRTSILNEIGEYDNSLDGTFYSFWFFLWQKLYNGGKLFYHREPYIKCTMLTNNNNFGLGLDRMMVEFNGFSKAAEVLFPDPIFRRNFVEVLKNAINRKELINKMCYASIEQKEKFKKSLESCQWSKQEIDELFSFISFRHGAFVVISIKCHAMLKFLIKHKIIP